MKPIRTIVASTFLVAALLVSYAPALQHSTLTRCELASLPHDARASVASKATCGAALPGAWTGFSGAHALGDEYSLQWSDESAGTFSAVYVVGKQGWSIGKGQIAVGEATAAITFDSGVALQGQVAHPSPTHDVGIGKGFMELRILVPVNAQVQDDCSTLVWDNNSTWRKMTPIKFVHIVSMNHLDVGYNGIPGLGLINNILNMYFQTYFPRAVALSQVHRVYIHTWILIDLFICLCIAVLRPFSSIDIFQYVCIYTFRPCGSST